MPLFSEQGVEWYYSVIGAVFGGMIIYPIFPMLLPFLSSLIGGYCLAWGLEVPNNYYLIGAFTIFGFFVQRLLGVKKANLEE